jgi:cytochrome P450
MALDQAGPSNPDWHPWMPGAISVTSYADVQEVLLNRACHVFTCGPGSESVWGGVITTSNGESHVGRRRWLAPLVSRSAIARFDVEILDRAMHEYLDNWSPDRAQAPVDLIALIRLMLAPVISGLVGLDGIMGDAARARELLGYVDRFQTGGPLLRYATVPTEPLVRDAHDAIAAFVEVFFEPSRARRAALVEEHRAGRLSREELPDDLITLQRLAEAEGVEGFWTDETEVREALTMLAGGLQTTAAATAGALDAYFDWPDRSPEDVLDPELIRGVVNETLRLFPVVEFLPRIASEDVTLRSGRFIPSGMQIVVNLFLANRDPEVFGADAEVFRPDRYKRLSPHYPQYGFAFGAGTHLCIGRPLATQGGTDPRETAIPRIIPKLLAELLRRGVEPAPGDAPTAEATYRRILRTYPVVFPQLARALSQ